MVRPYAFVAIALLALLTATLAGVPAYGKDVAPNVDLELRGRDAVSSTLRPATEFDHFRCELPRGAVISASAKAKGKPAPALRMALQFAGTDVPGATVTAKKSALTLAPFAVTQSGAYRIEVRGDDVHDGDFTLAVSWKPRAKWTGTGTDLAAAGAAQFDFAAPAGAMATIAVLPAAHSGFVAQLGDLTGPDGFTQALAPKTPVALPVTGDYSVHFTNAGAQGAWTAVVTLRLPKVPKSKTDIRDSALSGSFGGDNPVLGRVVGPGGGTVDAGDLGGTSLAGASVSVPPGALGTPLVLTIGAADPLATGPGSHAAGPAIEFGPSGTVFDPSGSNAALKATITLPYDPAAFPQGTDTLVVYVRDAAGHVTEVPPPYVFNPDHTVTLQTSHFSSYQVATTGPRPFAGRFVIAELSTDVGPQSGATVRFGLHSMDSDGTHAATSLSTDELRWLHDAQLGATPTLVTDNQSNTFDVSVVDDATVRLANPQQPDDVPLDILRGASDDVLIAKDQAILFLRRAAAPPTASSVAGKWHLIDFEFRANPDVTQPPGFRFGLTGSTGSLTLSADGRVAFGPVRSAHAESGFPSGMWTVKSGGNGGDEGLTFVASGEQIVISSPGGDAIAFEPVLGGNLLVGRTTSSDLRQGGVGSELILLVRASSGLPKSAIGGNYTLVEQDFEFEDAGPQQGDQGLRFTVERLAPSITAAGVLTGGGTRDTQGHDSQGNPTMSANQTVDPISARAALRSDGWFTDDQGGAGAIVPGALFIRTQFDAQGFSLAFAFPNPVVIPGGKR